MKSCNLETHKISQEGPAGSWGWCFPSWPPKTLLWAAAEAVSIQNRPLPQKLELIRKLAPFQPQRCNTVTTEQTQHLPPSSIHTTNPVPCMAILVRSGAERGVQEPPPAPLSFTVPGSCSRSLLPSPCPLRPEAFGRGLPASSFAVRLAPSKAVSAGIRPPHSPAAPGRLTASCSQPRCAAYLSPLLP